jgi:hypothetical protein
MSHPNELPEGGEGGGGIGRLHPGEFPQELPVDFHINSSIAELLREVIGLKARVNLLESTHLSNAVTARSARFTGVGGPNELPEGGEGGGGIGGVRPGEFPQELPVDFHSYLTQITERLSAVEKSVLTRIADLETQIGKIAQR